MVSQSKNGKLYIFSSEQLPHNGSISATSIPGTAKYLKGFAQAKTFKDKAAGMGNAQVAGVVSRWEEELSKAKLRWHHP